MYKRLMSRDNKSIKVPHRFLAPILALSSIAYVFRFPSPFGSVSLFRLSALALIFFAICKTLEIIWTMKVKVWSVRIIFGVLLIIIPTIIDLTYGVSNPSLSTPIYAFLFNLLFFLLFVLIVSRANIKIYLRWYCYLSVIEMIIALYMYFERRVPFEFIIKSYGSEYVQGLNMINIDNEFVRLTGTFFDPNFYGFYLVSVIIVSNWLYSYSNKNVGYFLLGCLSFVQLVLTASRTAMLGLLGVLLGILIIRRVSVSIALTIFCLIGVILILPIAFEGQLIDRLISSGSIYDRMEAFKRGFNAFLEYPFFGGGSDSLVDPDTGISTAHSVYISILGRSGFVGFMLYAFALIIIFYHPAVARQADRSQKEFIFQFLLMIGMIFISYDILYFFEPLFIWLAMTVVMLKSDGNAKEEILPVK